MKQLQGITVKGKGLVVIEDNPLGRGGEGSVFSVSSHSIPGLPDSSELVAKIYHDPKQGSRFEKVQAMVSNKPDSDSLAWPLAFLGNAQGFQGYVMRKLDSSEFRQWAELSNSKDRRASSPDFDVRYAMTASRNLAVAIASAHHVNAVVGDVNESNIFVGADASVLIVDTDSAQIKDKSGRIYPCTVGKPEYTAAELTHGRFEDHVRTAESDIFAFSVAVFQMLTGGGHPMAAVFEGKGDPPATVDKIRKGITPSLSSHRGFKAVPSIASEAIPSRLKSIMLRSLSPEPHHRISLETWVAAFDDVIAHLRQCDNEKLHWYDERDAKSCPLCKRKKEGKIDPWTNDSPVAAQAKLPPVGFKDAKKAPVKAPRARPAPPMNGSTTAPAPHAPSPHHAAPSRQHGAPAPQSSYSGSHSVPQQASRPVIPEKIKGRMVVHYADGTYGPRPDLSRLIQSNPKIAMQAVKVETPSLMRFWWGAKNAVANQTGIWIGLTLALILSASWYFIVPMLPLDNYVSSDIAMTILHYYSIVALVLGAIFSIGFAVSCYRDRKKKIKDHGSLAAFKEDNVVLTVLRFLPVPIVWGLIAVVVFIVGSATWLLMTFLGTLLEQNNNGVRR